jgi:Ca2+-binding RTX toxin-like protein
MVRFNNVFYSSFLPTNGILVRGRLANDNISISGNVLHDSTLEGGPGNDRLVGATGDDLILGGIGNDLILGRAGDNVMDGGIGNDQIAARNGRDILIGGSGIDALQGGSGRDILVGGSGADQLSGGLGNDINIAGEASLDIGQLQQVLAEWSSQTAADAIANIQAGVGGLPTLAPGSDVTLDDDSRDVLSDSYGDNWFFQSLADLDLLRRSTRNADTIEV